MIPEREYFLAKAEVERRRQAAAEARLAREARLALKARRAEQAEHGQHPRGAIGWLRRLAGVR